MPRYVDAEKELAEMKFAWYPQDMDTTNALGMYENFLSHAPSADVAPVVHAHWIRKGGWSTSMDCSNCGLVYEGRQDFTGSTYYSASDFCPQCGAKMDEEVPE